MNSPVWSYPGGHQAIDDLPGDTEIFSKGLRRPNGVFHDQILRARNVVRNIKQLGQWPPALAKPIGVQETQMVDNLDFLCPGFLYEAGRGRKAKIHGDGNKVVCEDKVMNADHGQGYLEQAEAALGRIGINAVGPAPSVSQHAVSPVPAAKT